MSGADRLIVGDTVRPYGGRRGQVESIVTSGGHEVVTIAMADGTYVKTLLALCYREDDQ